MNQILPFILYLVHYLSSSVTASGKGASRHHLPCLFPIHSTVSDILDSGFAQWLLFSFRFLLIDWLPWVFAAELGLSLAVVSGGLLSSSCVQASHCGGFSCGEWTQGHAGFSSCGICTSLSLGMWNLPGAGIEPVFPALVGRFLTTGPPGKPLTSDFLVA